MNKRNLGMFLVYGGCIVFWIILALILIWELT